jgi:hypothetical protein
VWLRNIVTQTQVLNELVSYWCKGDDLEHVIYAMLEQSESLLYKLNNKDCLALIMKIYGLPRCMEILIDFFNNCVAPNPLRKGRWIKSLQMYRNNMDSVWLMEVVSSRITQFSVHGASNCHFTDTCPPENLHMIKSLYGESDWSRAVWCVYSQLKRRGFALPFTTDVMIHMEGWLTEPHRTVFPECVEVLITIYETIHLNPVLEREWNDKLQIYRESGDCVSLMTYVAQTLYRLGINYISVVPCPHQNVILSPDGKTDWTFAVWCIFMELQEPREYKYQFNFVFDAEILTKMEVWLKSEYFLSHPHTPAPPTSQLLSAFHMLY